MTNLRAVPTCSRAVHERAEPVPDDVEVCAVCLTTTCPYPSRVRVPRETQPAQAEQHAAQFSRRVHWQAAAIGVLIAAMLWAALALGGCSDDASWQQQPQPVLVPHAWYPSTWWHHETVVHHVVTPAPAHVVVTPARPAVVVRAAPVVLKPAMPAAPAARPTFRAVPSSTRVSAIRVGGRR